MPLFEIHHRHDHHFHPCEGTASVLASIAALSASIEALKGITMATKEETVQQLQALAQGATELAEASRATGTQVEKVTTEVQKLIDAVNNSGNTDPAITAAVESAQVALNDARNAAAETAQKIQVVDDLNPDGTGGEEQPQG